MTEINPYQMERTTHRDDYKNGSLTIHFTNASHLCDSWNHARKIGKQQEFESAMWRLIQMSLGAAIPRKEFVWGGSIPPTPESEGKDRVIKIYPDAHTQPSFGWNEENGMVGGLIFHASSQEWMIHT